ncbi:c-type cytochrome biogenesis protein CcmI [Thioalkalivibrio sp. HK1]|uniref:c-type cytochrome biogenesis protein CcmI n=1 Tax=Thioalkalivibrio sp. HK1 TaxID=1469245 RepID=UPI0004BAEA09|nr:c-type cytochrome biogenesis protein CcmI [Thioalkalivibrio sp. HK1]
MITFWLLAALMIAAVLLWILPPLLRRPPSDEKPDAEAAQETGESERINLALYRERMEELNREYRDRRIDKERYENLRDDLERGLIADIGIADDPEDSEDPKTEGESAKDSRGESLRDEIPSPPSTPAASPRPSASISHYSMPIALALAIPIFGIVIYLQVGTPRAIDPERDAIAGAAGTEMGALSVEERSDLERMAKEIEARLEDNPDDAESWILLAQARMDLDDPGAAVGAYERAYAIQGDDPSLLTDWAQAEMELSISPDFPQSAIARIERALEIDPDHPGALWIGGFASFGQGQRERALARWERLQALLPQQSDEAKMLTEWLVRVRSGALADQGQGESVQGSASIGDSTLGRDPETSDRKIGTGDEDGSEGDLGSAVIESQAPDPLTARIEVELDIEPDLAKTLGGDETIFVFARPAPDASGSGVDSGAFGPPLAVVRTTLSALPTTVALDDSSAMMAGRSLSSAQTVIVSARLSLTGTVERTSGDIEGISEPMPSVGSQEPIRILLSQVVP